ncbi:DNA-binding response regulator [Streptomyces spiroverticillatus]|uniref:DNA-binding response regulator n=1 Tax=Streptomyces finlayi TaxID=67296 RepID=A0A918WXA3_9ACTN|nr:response regulator transcription factor [Streptomyces finlayi]GHA08099.1 DNA-binding response regulator [Streptomyces spiroverticillatus]GHC91176.1 DNA-binding response regulator [Streptomyces finlayi]
MNAKIKVLVADDQRLVRAGFRSILEDEDDLEVVGEAGDGEEAVAKCRALRPDVVLLDIRMPGVDGLEAARRIAADPRLGDVKVVILTTFDLDEYVYGALRAGATGFLVKDTEPEELVRAVRVAHRGEALISPSVTRRLIAEFAGRVKAPGASPRLNALTAREREVMELVAAGLSNDEIAARLVLSPATSKTHVSRIMTKLDVRDRSQLVVLAYESGMVRPGWLSGE